MPVSLAVPGSAVQVPTPTTQDRKNASIDLLGVVTDEQGTGCWPDPDTMQIPAAQVADAREQAAAVSVWRDAAGRPLQGQGRRPRKHGRHDGHVRVSDHDSGSEDRAASRSVRLCSARSCDSHAVAAPVDVAAPVVREDAGGPGGGPGGGRAELAADLAALRRPGFDSQRGGGFDVQQRPNPLLRGGQEIVQSLSHVVDAGSADVLLLRGLRPDAPGRGPGGDAPDQDEPRVLSRPREGVRDAGRRADHP